MAFAFSLSLLAHFGETKHPASFYVKKYLNAFPMLLEETDWDNPERHLTNCFTTRFFSRFAVWWGLAELIEPFDIFNAGNCPVRKGKLLDEVFRVARMEG